VPTCLSFTWHGFVCRDEGSTFQGRYLIKGNKVFCVVVYTNSRGTEIRSILKIRSTRAGGAGAQPGTACCDTALNSPQVSAQEASPSTRGEPCTPPCMPLHASCRLCTCTPERATLALI
jgi:hypothetical protein